MLCLCVCVCVCVCSTKTERSSVVASLCLYFCSAKTQNESFLVFVIVLFLLTCQQKNRQNLPEKTCFPLCYDTCVWLDACFFVFSICGLSTCFVPVPCLLFLPFSYVHVFFFYCYFCMVWTVVSSFCFCVVT